MPEQDTGKYLLLYSRRINLCSNANYVPNTVDPPPGFTVWLASAESDFVRGRMLWATWDIDELKAKKDEILKGDLLKMILSG
jgi:hypothetical protein